MPSNTRLYASSGGNRRIPISTFERFDEVHHANHEQMRRYLQSRRVNGKTLDRWMEAELEPRAAHMLPSNNNLARIRFSKIVAAHLLARIERLPSGVPLAWITLTPLDFAMSEARATTFRLRKLQEWCRGMVGPFGFVGMVEAALFTNVTMPWGPRTISLHAHLIVWGLDAGDVAELEHRAEVGSLVPGLPSVKVVPLPRGTVLEKTLYMLKNVQSEYRAYPLKGEVIDWQTGEITKATTGSYSLQKRALRPGDRVALYRINANRYLDRLLFGGGDGEQVVAAVKREALATYRSRTRRPIRP